MGCDDGLSIVHHCVWGGVLRCRSMGCDDGLSIVHHCVWGWGVGVYEYGM